MDENEGEGEDSMDDTSTQPESSYDMPNFNIADMQPRQALLDRVNAHSSSNPDALSNSNQFDQAQVVDQTFYQPKQQQPRIIITQPATRSYGGGQKKYKSNCYQQVQVQPTVETPNVQVPLLRQVFTTVTRKHDNLNTANANSDKSLDVQFQAGPSLEVEGSASASEYAKQKGAEHSDDGSGYPIVMVQPAQDETYSTPVVDTQCIEGCSDQDTQYTEPMEDAQCGDDCANQDSQYTEPMEDNQ
ncbi:hypothetical protein K493DRAFT_357137 [Basidiobolus meristosporus CBS 931.73]|uniref:Uncharacterized protein n=1 Tax=Basidiobolus meristosporus CBS 931.73 TaxID=1314790 RepID=A0A1Y1XWZ6_9FUNG|nr:hypothetical protein K493DRAFT_357137 [Basidiobolus meristosporus CBS 931.73]|eukprot:ORX90185.1 hypothetical protein K493DRAFT_357137 [Basidiobolus meristosporus CBS 931.73]